MHLKNYLLWSMLTFCGGGLFALDLPESPEIELGESALRSSLDVQHKIIKNETLGYERHLYTLTAKDKPITIKRITFFKDLVGAKINGNTDGSVIIFDDAYLGIEHPMAKVEFKPLDEKKWTATDFAAAKQDISISGLVANDELSISFIYEKGPDRIDIESVALCDDQGKILSQDKHDGFSGIQRKNNVYRLKTPAEISQFCILKITYKSLSRTNSYGKILIESKKHPGKVSGWLNRNYELPAGESWTFGVVYGKYAEGQLRRTFQNYLEAERAHPYRVFPHYNSWFHLGLKTHNNENPLERLTEKKALKAMADFSRELYTKRGVTIDSYLWDDGWDEWDSLWEYHKGFPEGFTNLAKQAKLQKAGIGAWLSPWGGYNKAKTKRVAHAKKIGLPTNAGGLSLAQKKYYEAFRDRCLQMIRDYNMNLFKFDGIGGGVNAKGANDSIAADLQGLLNHIAALRQVKPDVFINCTVGTWPSPFWLFHADSIWRGDSDWGCAGTGNKREQWITYRDKIIYNRFAKPCPLFPLNSIMSHGIIVTDIFGMPVNDSPEATTSFANEVWTGVACGADLQEYYINPEMMSSHWWDILADAIKWLRSNEAVLRDSHWFGADPGKGEVYGYASWSPEKAILLIRNPSKNAVTWAGSLNNAEQVYQKLADEFEVSIDQINFKNVSVRYASSEDKTIDLKNGINLAPYETKVIEFSKK